MAKLLHLSFPLSHMCGSLHENVSQAFAHPLPHPKEEMSFFAKGNWYSRFYQLLLPLGSAPSIIFFANILFTFLPFFRYAY